MRKLLSGGRLKSPVGAPLIAARDPAATVFKPQTHVCLTV